MELTKPFAPFTAASTPGSFSHSCSTMLQDRSVCSSVSHTRPKLTIRPNSKAHAVVGGRDSIHQGKRPRRSFGLLQVKFLDLRVRSRANLMPHSYTELVIWLVSARRRILHLSAEQVAFVGVVPRVPDRTNPVDLLQPVRMGCVDSSCGTEPILTVSDRGHLAEPSHYQHVLEGARRSMKCIKDVLDPIKVVAQPAKIRLQGSH